MEFGMPTLLELPTLEENMTLGSRLGFDFIELNMCLPMYQTDTMDVAALSRLSDMYGLYYTVHLEEAFDVCIFNRLVSQAWMEVVRRLIDVAKSLCVPILNMHLPKGTYFTLPDRKEYLYASYQKHYLDRLRTFRDASEMWIGSSDIHICVENTGGFAPCEQAGIELLLESPVFALTWDVGHSHSSHDIDVPFLLAHQDRIRHFHLHDAIGEKHHLAFGRGEIDLVEKIAFARDLEQRNGHLRAVVETKTVQALEDSAAWLGERPEFLDRQHRG